MEVYILDSLYRRIAVVDTYQSLIWTERFSAWGDFQLDIISTTANKTLFRPNTLLSIAESYRVMTVETVEDVTDEEGREILKITGRSLEKILDDRLVMYIGEPFGEWVRWFVFGEPYDKAVEFFQVICLDGVLDDGDVIPGVTIGSDIFPEDTLDPSTEELAYYLDPKSVYAATKEICDAYSMGFRLVRHPVTAALYYDIYLGSDRTSAQTTLPAVVFSPGLENLANTRELTTSAMYKNVAYVVYGEYHEIVYALDVDPDIEGFERRVLYLLINTLETDDPGEISDQLIQLGTAELAKYRNLTVLDGEVVGNRYRYGTDYNLGDLVESRDADGSTAQMRVTEQIFTSDKTGVKSHPTLSIEQFITPGSWLSASPVLEWDDYTTEEWDDV